MEKELKAPVAEIFTSCQMEGPTIGTPSVFIRFWGCNLRCQFNSDKCDTVYAVKTDRNKARQYTAEGLAQEINKYIIEHYTKYDTLISNLVITGGEPFLYQEFLLHFFKELDKILSFKPTIEIETNGTISVLHGYKICNKVYDMDDYVTQYNVSVKLSNSNQETKTYDKRRINKKALNTFPVDKSIFKFVVDGNADMFEIKQLTREYNFPVYLMPQGMTRADIIKKGPEVVYLAIMNGYKYSPREHIILWDKKRGV